MAEEPDTKPGSVAATGTERNVPDAKSTGQLPAARTEGRPTAANRRTMGVSAVLAS